MCKNPAAIFSFVYLIYSVCSNRCCWRRRDAANEYFELYSIVQQQGIPAAVHAFSIPQYGAYDSNDFPAIGQNSAYSHNQSLGGKKILGFFGWQGTGNCIWWQRWAITAGKRGKGYCNKFMRRQPVAKRTNLVDFREMDFKSNLLASRVPTLVLIIFHLAQGYGLQFNCVPFCFDCENLATQGSNTPLNLFQRKVHLNPRLEYGLPER